MSVYQYNLFRCEQCGSMDTTSSSPRINPDTSSMMCPVCWHMLGLALWRKDSGTTLPDSSDCSLCGLSLVSCECGRVSVQWHGPEVSESKGKKGGEAWPPRKPHKEENQDSGLSPGWVLTCTTSPCHVQRDMCSNCR